MISYKVFIKQKFETKKKIDEILKELLHDNYILEINSEFENKPAFKIRWFSKDAPRRIHEFRELFEDRCGDIYYLETVNSDITNIHYYILKRDKN